MAICPNCHVKDKNFFAGKCHACNTPVGFIEQILHSLMWTTVNLGMFIFFFYAIYWLTT